MNTVKKITFLSFIRPLIFPNFLFLFFFFCGIELWLLFEAKNEYLELSISLVFFLYLIIPSLIIQYNYYKVDKNKTLKIDDNLNEVTITNKLKIYNFPIDHIDRIRKVHSKDFVDLYRILIPWKQHYYYVICLKNDEEFLVTRLVVPKLEKILNVRIVYKRAFFPLITNETLKRVTNG